MKQKLNQLLRKKYIVYNKRSRENLVKETFPSNSTKSFFSAAVTILFSLQYGKHRPVRITTLCFAFQYLIYSLYSEPYIQITSVSFPFVQLVTGRISFRNSIFVRSFFLLVSHQCARFKLNMQLKLQEKVNPNSISGSRLYFVTMEAWKNYFASNSNSSKKI